MACVGEWVIAENPPVERRLFRGAIGEAAIFVDVPGPYVLHVFSTLARD